MPHVKISYDPDLSKIGTVVEVDEAQAQQMVSSGRGVLVRKPAARKSAKKAATAGKAPARRAAKKAPANKPTPRPKLDETDVADMQPSD